MSNDGVEVAPEGTEEVKEFIDPTQFPKMIYHIVEGQKIVNSPSEYEKFLAEGWGNSPEEFNEVAALTLKIKLAKKELKVMEDNLAAKLEEDGLEEDDSDEEKPVIRKRRTR